MVEEAGHEAAAAVVAAVEAARPPHRRAGAVPRLPGPAQPPQCTDEHLSCVHSPSTWYFCTKTSLTWALLDAGVLVVLLVAVRELYLVLLVQLNHPDIR